MWKSIQKTILYYTGHSTKDFSPCFICQFLFICPYLAKSNFKMQFHLLQDNFLLWSLLPGTPSLADGEGSLLFPWPWLDDGLSHAVKPVFIYLGLTLRVDLDLEISILFNLHLNVYTCFLACTQQRVAICWMNGSFLTFYNEIGGEEGPEN
jgi:hypothetical protein